jgi:hypothetical protein
MDGRRHRVQNAQWSLTSGPPPFNPPMDANKSLKVYITPQSTTASFLHRCRDTGLKPVPTTYVQSSRSAHLRTLH